MRGGQHIRDGRLRGWGKKTKVVLIAVARKLTTIGGAVVR